MPAVVVVKVGSTRKGWEESFGCHDVGRGIPVAAVVVGAVVVAAEVVAAGPGSGAAAVGSECSSWLDIAVPIPTCDWVGCLHRYQQR